MRQKAYAEGLRALVHYTASVQDRILQARYEGEHAGEDPAALDALNDLLLPLVKGAGSERSYELLGSESLQTFGGSGFLQDYPIEQYVRDAKIDTLYEGTTAIQGQDLFFRKVLKDDARAFDLLTGEIAAFVDVAGGNGRFKDERALLATALDDVRAMVDWMTDRVTESRDDERAVYLAGLNTTRLLLSLADLVVGWLLLRQAEVATARLDDSGSGTGDASFYTGKVAAARFFAATVLPELSARRAVTESTTLDVMDLPVEAF
jgi:hypothetical protein